MNKLLCSVIILLFVFQAAGCSQNQDFSFEELLSSESIRETLISNEGIECRVVEAKKYGGVLIDCTELDAIGTGIDHPDWANGIAAHFLYPQISSPASATEAKINLMILDILWKKFGEEVNLVDIGCLLSGEKLTGIISVDAACEILSLTADRISLMFTSRTSGVTWTKPELFFATINLSSGAYQVLDHTFAVDQISEAIRSGLYEVLEGGYAGGWCENRMSDAFAGAFELEHRKERIAELDSCLPGWWENGKSTQTLSLGGNPYEYEEFNSLSAGNFGIDQDYVYITFYYDDSLHSSVSLKIPLQERDR